MEGQTQWKYKTVVEISIYYFKYNRKYSPYVGQILAPEEGFGLGWRLSFLPFGQKRLIMPFGQKWLNMLVWQNLGNFWCSVVTLPTFSSNRNIFENNLKQSKKYLKKMKKSYKKMIEQKKYRKFLEWSLTRALQSTQFKLVSAQPPNSQIFKQK